MKTSATGLFLAVLSTLTTTLTITTSPPASARSLDSLRNPVSDAAFPLGPDDTLTPGSVCTHPTEYRYPEHISYCKRSVDSDLKRKVMQVYDEKLGYETTRMNRQDFKIDHYIPLCAGGSNEASNLWPQHESVFEITDQLEQAVCEAMARGALLQKDAIAMIKEGKHNLNQVDRLVRTARGLSNRVTLETVASK